MPEFSTGALSYDIPLFALGIFMLVKGSDWFVEGAAFVARYYRISEIVIGLTLVSIGTSLPEMGANVYASVLGEGDIALGNVIGSNITNILLVGGVGIMMLGSIPVARIMLYRDTAVMLGCYAVFAVQCFFFLNSETRHFIGRAEGVVLFAMMLLYLALLFRKRGEMESELINETEEVLQKVASMRTALLYLLLGAAMISVGAKLLVDNVVSAARSLNVPRGIISATVVAFGTSVPELAVTVAGVLKGKNDIALGNVIGSCTFNLLLVLSVSSMINPVEVSDQMLVLMVLMAMTGLLMALFMRTSWNLTRWEGVVFLTLYGLFIAYSVWAGMATDAPLEQASGIASGGG